MVGATIPQWPKFKWMNFCEPLKNLSWEDQKNQDLSSGDLAIDHTDWQFTGDLAMVWATKN